MGFIPRLIYDKHELVNIIPLTRPVIYAAASRLFRAWTDKNKLVRFRDGRTLAYRVDVSDSE